MPVITRISSTAMGKVNAAPIIASFCQTFILSPSELDIERCQYLLKHRCPGYKCCRPCFNRRFPIALANGASAGEDHRNPRQPQIPPHGAAEFHAVEVWHVEIRDNGRWQGRTHQVQSLNAITCTENLITEGGHFA